MRVDGTRRDSLTPLQKYTVSILQLATSVSVDTFDKYFQIANTTRQLCLKKFCKAIIRAYSAEYLRRPTPADVTRLLQMHETRHVFPGMLGSLDCMHWAWHNCPKAWHGAFIRGDQGESTLILEVVAFYDLWIWHAFFVVSESNNDIKIFNQSPLFADILEETSSPVTFEVNQHYYQIGYYLCEDIYPAWPTFVKSLPMACNAKDTRFKKMQEAARKDVERAFEVLQARWRIIRDPARPWHDEASSNGSSDASRSAPPSFEEYVQRDAILRDRNMHAKLQVDWIEHVWALFVPLGSE